MGLKNEDIFIVNRQDNTLKAHAEDIGDYLITEPRPGGESNNQSFVNDGLVQIEGVDSSQSSDFKLSFLTSANTYKDTNLTFAEGFYLNRTYSNECHYITVMHDMNWLIDTMFCLNGNLSGTGGIEQVGQCAQLNMEWLAANILCNGGSQGLEVSPGSKCIQVKLCGDSGLEIGPSNCLKFNWCNDAGLTQGQGGCMMLDMPWLADNIRCDNSGIDFLPGGCIFLDPHWIADHITCDPKSNGIIMGENHEVTKEPCLYVDCDYIQRECVPCGYVQGCADYDWINQNMNDCVTIKKCIDKAYIISKINKSDLDQIAGCDVCDTGGPPSGGGSGKDYYIKNDQSYNGKDEIKITLTTKSSDGNNHIIEKARQDQENGPVRPGVLTGSIQKVTNMKISGGWMTGRSGLTEGNSNAVIGCGWNHWSTPNREHCSGFASANDGQKFYTITRLIRICRYEYDQEPAFAFLCKNPNDFNGGKDPIEDINTNPGKGNSVLVDGNGQLHRNAAYRSLYDQEESIFDIETKGLETKETGDFWNQFNRLHPKKLSFKSRGVNQQSAFDALGVQPKEETENNILFGFVAEDVAEISPRFAHYVWDKPQIGALVPGSGKDVWDADDDGTPKVFRDGVDNVSYPDPEAKMVPDDIRSEAILAYAVVAAQLLKKGKIDVLGHNIPGPYADDQEAANHIPVDAVYKAADGTIRWRME